MEGVSSPSICHLLSSNLKILNDVELGIFPSKRDAATSPCNMQRDWFEEATAPLSFSPFENPVLVLSNFWKSSWGREGNNVLNFRPILVLLLLLLFFSSWMLCYLWIDSNSPHGLFLSLCYCLLWQCARSQRQISLSLALTRGRWCKFWISEQAAHMKLIPTSLSSVVFSTPQGPYWSQEVHSLFLMGKHTQTTQKAALFAAYPTLNAI